jgi:hypothetical protein
MRVFNSQGNSEKKGYNQGLKVINIADKQLILT